MHKAHLNFSCFAEAKRYARNGEPGKI
ncbi:uncharacterized protein G2W53_001534 [Senna tora]|uniref:Uncharacterized protein n=1 Tax=Senna tora TaxID=362788 RepID=A0A834XG40_9FABA|nr:uncharacterized protein G2W53_001534 [Senna tora]